MREIPLTQGFVALVDDEDYEALADYTWCAARFSGKTFYALRSVRVEGRTQNFTMHRELMRPPDGLVVDHRNGNGLDNRRSNLRLATRSQNMHNRNSQGGSSRFKGVCWLRRKGRWLAYIGSNRGRTELGHFRDEAAAARAYDAAARERYGEFAALNFPNPGEQNADRARVTNGAAK